MNFNNLHALAATVIPQQSMSWIRFKENSENAMGVTVPVYYDPETITGSLQPMDAQDVAKLGLSIRSEHATLHTSADVKPAKKGEQPDRIIYAGRTFEPVAITNWSAQDGWRNLVMVAV